MRGYGQPVGRPLYRQAQTMTQSPSNSSESSVSYNPQNIISEVGVVEELVNDVAKSQGEEESDKEQEQVEAHKKNTQRNIRPLVQELSIIRLEGEKTMTNK